LGSEDGYTGGDLPLEISAKSRKFQDKTNAIIGLWWSVKLGFAGKKQTFPELPTCFGLCMENKY
jgi:hypothetical protein